MLARLLKKLLEFAGFRQKGTESHIRRIDNVRKIAHILKEVA